MNAKQWTNPGLAQIAMLQRIPHALLLQTRAGCDLMAFLHIYVTKILTQAGCSNVEQIWERIAAGTYADFVVIDGQQQGIIKKTTILELKDRFQTFQVEATGLKIALIKNFERANEAAVNALLKFLEEPEQQIFFVLTTPVDFSQLPDTIVSRCERFRYHGGTNDGVPGVAPEWRWMLLAFPTRQDFDAFVNFEGGKLYATTTSWIQQFVEHQQFREAWETFKGWDYAHINRLLSILLHVPGATISFQRVVVNLLPTLVANPTKSLLFFTIWEAWS